MVFIYISYTVIQIWEQNKWSYSQGGLDIKICIWRVCFNCVSNCHQLNFIFCTCHTCSTCYLFCVAFLCCHSDISSVSSLALSGGNRSHPPSPLLFLLSTDNVLAGFHMLNSHPNVPPLVMTPQPLVADGERKHTGISLQYLHTNAILPGLSIVQAKV